jgi:hypothetical protein
MSKIFISIASYRDPELLKTLHDCINNAKKPENLVFGIAWQHNEADEWDTLDEFKDDPRFRIINIPYQHSRGACWARSLIQKLYNKETYTLQLDSHHRFIKHWDVELINMFKQLKKKGHKKPLLTSYIAGYFPDKDPEGRVNEVWTLNIDRYLPEGAVFLRPHTIPNWQNLTEPYPSRFISGHFIFTTGKFNTEIPYDPELYFHGEETSLSARAFTSGYDLFSPHKVIIWHEYTREGKTKQWDDDKEWDAKNQKSYARFRSLFRMGGEEDMTGFGFGTERTLEEYEHYAGLKFSTRQIHKETINNETPPIKGDYESGLCNKIKHCIDVYKGSLTETDYNCFVVAMLDENNNDLYRRDLDELTVKSLIEAEPNNNFIHIWVEYEDIRRPYMSRVWPNSTSKGWCERIEQVIKYE